MRIIYIFFLLLFSFGFISCTNNKGNKEIQHPKIVHLQDSYYYRYFLFKNFQDNENCIKYLFDFIGKENGDKWVLTNEEGITFEDGSAILDTSYQRFSIDNTGNKFYGAKINYLKSTKIAFKKETEKDTIKLLADFDSLNVNIVQNFLNYAKENEVKKTHEKYTYELYNKNKIRKVRLTYHEYGEWFEIEVL
jgi:hypothetical protein